MISGTTSDALETDRNYTYLLISYPIQVTLPEPVMSLKTISSLEVGTENWQEVKSASWRCLSGGLRAS